MANDVDPLGGILVEKSTKETPAAAPSDVQLPAMEAGGPQMVAPDEAYLPGRKVSEGDLGLQRAYFGAFNNMVLALPDAALNAGAFAAEKAGLLSRTSDNPQENRDILTRFFNAANYPERDRLLGIFSLGKGEQIKPETLGEKIAAGTGEATLYATAFPAMASAAAEEGAYLAAPMVEGIEQRYLTQTGTKALGPMFQKAAQEYVTAFKNAPARVLASEIAGGAASGALGTATKEIIEPTLGVNESSGVEWAGKKAASEGLTGTVSFAGGFVPSGVSWLARTLPKLSLVRNVIKYGSRLIPGSTAEKVMYKEAQTDIGNQMLKAFKEAKAAGRLQEAEEIMRQFREAGYPLDLSPAEMTQHPTLRMAQEEAQSTANFDQAEAFRARTQGNVSRIINYSNDPNLVDPEAPTAVVKQLQSAADTEARLQQIGMEELRAEGEDIAARLPMARSRAEQGAIIRKALIDAKEAKKKELDAFADEIGINEANPGTLMNPVKKMVRDKYFLDNDTDRYLPKVIRDFATSEDNVINFQTWKRYRDKVSDELSAAIANKQSSDIVNLTKFKEDLDKFGNMFYGTNKNWNTFKTRYAEEYAKPFERGVAYEVTTPSPASRPGDTRYLTSDEAVADAFTRNVENAKDFMNLYRDNPEAVNSMRNVILDGARVEVIGKSGPYEGTVDPTKLQTFINKNREVLDTLGLKDELENIQNLSKQFGMRSAELKDRAKAIGQDKANRLINNITDGTYSPEEFIDAAIKDPKMMKTITDRAAQAEDPNLTEAIKRAVWTRVFKTNNLEDPGSFMEFAKTHERSLKMAMGDEHYNRMMTSAKGMGLALYAQQGLDGMPLEAMTGLEKFAKATGVSPASFANAVAAAARGQVKETWLALSFGLKLLNTRQRIAYNKVMSELLVDSNLARELAERAAGDGMPTQKQANRMKAWMLNVGLQPDGRPYEEERPVENVPIPKELFLGEGETRKPELPSDFENLPPFLNKPLPQKATPNVTVTFPESDPSPSNPFNQPAPAAPLPRGNANRVEYQSLFPNDTLGAAINNRNGPQ